MPVSQVIDLLTRWRSSTGMRDRGRLVSDTVRTLRALTPEERRIVARSLAERGIAPALTERFSGTSEGSREIRPDELVRGFVAMDRDQLDGMIADLRDSEKRAQLGRETFDRMTAPPPAAGTNLPVADVPVSAASPGPPPVPPAPPGLGGPTDLAGEPPSAQEPPAAGPELMTSASSADAVPASEPEPSTPDPSEPEDEPLGAVTLNEPQLDIASVHDVELQTVEFNDPVGADESSFPADIPDPQASLDTDAGIVTDVVPPDVDATDVAPTDAADGSVPGARDRGAETPAASGADAVIAQVARAGTAYARLAALPRDLNSPDAQGLDSANVVRLLAEIPDGWQRRRAAQRLVDLDAVAVDDAVRVLAMFERTSDAMFVAGALVAAKNIDPERFEATLGARAVRRLAIRAAR